MYNTKSPLVVGNKVALYTTDNRLYAGAVVEIDESSVVLEKASLKLLVGKAEYDYPLGELHDCWAVRGYVHFQKSNIVSVISWPSDKPTQDERHV